MREATLTKLYANSKIQDALVRRAIPGAPNLAGVFKVFFDEAQRSCAAHLVWDLSNSLPVLWMTPPALPPGARTEKDNAASGTLADYLLLYPSSSPPFPVSW